MGTLWSLIKGLALFFVTVIALLVVLDGSLLANLMRKGSDS
jgi:hypothetical protein